MNEIQRQAVLYFVGQGWTAAQAAGIVANLWTESHLNPDAVGDGGKAYGVAQWHPDRQAGFAAIIGHDIRGSTLEEQLAYVHAELQGSEKVAGDALSSCTTADDAGRAVSRLYERPADTEGEATRRGALAQTILEQYAGTAPTSGTIPTAALTPQGAPMGIALALLPLLAQYVPQLMTLIKPNSVSTARDAAVAQTALNAAAQVAGVLQPGEQAGASHVAATVEKMQADPTLAAKVQAAIVTHPDIMPYLTVGEIGGGIPAARAANVIAPDAKWWSGFAAPVFVFGLILCGMILLILGNILGMPWGGSFQSWSNEVRASVISAIIGAALGAITGYWFGTTLQSAKKDNIIAQQAGAQFDTTQG